MVQDAYAPRSIAFERAGYALPLLLHWLAFGYKRISSEQVWLSDEEERLYQLLCIA